METVNPRAGFLCNYEVLSILKAQMDARKASIAVLKDARAERLERMQKTGHRNELEDQDIERLNPGDLATVSFECIKYLEEDVHPLRRQSTAAISDLLTALQELELTKAERLQIVNLAPTSLVELVVCVDDLEARFSDDQRDHILSLVHTHLSSEASTVTAVKTARTNGDVYMAEEEEEDDGAVGEDPDDEEFVNEPLGGGGGEQQPQELDEEAET